MVPEEILERTTVDEVPPRYLRKQKPADPKRRRLRQAGKAARRGSLLVFLALVAGGTIAGASYLLLFSPATRLGPSQIEITGTRYIPGSQLASVFSADLGRSVFRVPLDKRLAAIQAIPWVRSAAVERVLPNRLNVQVVEREPVAFLNTNAGMKLIDAGGVILDLPKGARFNLPVVSGLDETIPAAERARRLQMFSDFMQAIATVVPGIDSKVSEANLSNPGDVQATLAGLPVLAGQGPVVVHFGDADFALRFRAFLADFTTWQARAGNVEAVDLRYDGQALVTPEVPLATGNSAGAAAAAGPAANAAMPSPPLSLLAAQTAAGTAPVSVSGKNSKRGARQ